MKSSLAPHRDALIDLARTDADPRVRRRSQCLVILCASASQATASRVAGVSASSLRRWRERFVAHGRAGLADAPRYGRPRKLDLEAEALLERLLTEVPTEYGYATATWTLADIRDLLARQGWVVSVATVDRTVHRLGYGYQRPRHDLTHRQDADAVATAKQTLAVLQKKGLLTPEEYASCISTSATCTPIPTWQRYGSCGASDTPSPLQESISGSRFSVPWSTAPER